MRRTDSLRSQIVTLDARHIDRRILLIRGHKVILDSDLAVLYGVETKALKRAVRRNPERFPDGFMFHLTWEEALRCQSGALDAGRGRHRKYRPYVFTEQGVAMLSSVLHSRRAIQVNIEIMKTFVRLREMAGVHKDLARRLDALERKYNTKFRIIFDAIRRLVSPPEPSRKPIGFRPHPRR